MALADERRHLLQPHFVEQLLVDGVPFSDVPGRFTHGDGARPEEVGPFFDQMGFDMLVRLLRPAGHLFIYEGHPQVPLWTWNSKTPGIRRDRSYFGRCHVNDTFPAHGAVEWQWTLAEIINAVIAVGLDVVHVAEYAEPFWRPKGMSAAAWQGRLPNAFALLAHDHCESRRSLPPSAGGALRRRGAVSQDAHVLGVTMGGSYACGENDPFSDVDMECYLVDEVRTGVAELHQRVRELAPMLLCPVRLRLARPAPLYGWMLTASLHRITAEESMLAAHLGPAYQEYMRETSPLLTRVYRGPGLATSRWILRRRSASRMLIRMSLLSH